MRGTELVRAPTRSSDQRVVVGGASLEAIYLAAARERDVKCGI